MPETPYHKMRAPERCPRTLQILHYMRDHASRFGLPPTIGQVQHALRIGSSSTVHWHFRRLLQYGYIRKEGSRYILTEPKGDIVIETLRMHAGEAPWVAELLAILEDR